MKTLLTIILGFWAISCTEGNVTGSQVKKDLKMMIGRKLYE